jgi:protein TonB
MSDPRRWVEEGSSLEGALLRAARADAPPEASKRRALEALRLSGLNDGAPGRLTASSAPNPSAGMRRAAGPSLHAALFQGVLGPADRRAGRFGVGRAGVAAAAVIHVALLALLLAPRPGPAGVGSAGVEVDLRAAAPAGSAAPRVVPGGPGMTPAVLISGRDPAYTREALEARAEGIVAVKCTITAEGALAECRVLQSVSHMDQAVLDAMTTWRYTPATQDGRAVAIEHVFTIRLVLPG